MAFSACAGVSSAALSVGRVFSSSASALSTATCGGSLSAGTSESV